MTKLCLWADKQNDVSQSEDALSPKLNYSTMEQKPQSYQYAFFIKRSCYMKYESNI